MIKAHHCRVRLLQVWFSNRRARWRKQTANSVGGAESDDVTLRHRPIDQSTLASQLQHPAIIDKPNGKLLKYYLRLNYIPGGSKNVPLDKMQFLDNR